MMDQIVRNTAVGAVALVGAKYLDAKLDLHYDISLITAWVSAKIKYEFVLC